MIKQYLKTLNISVAIWMFCLFAFGCGIIKQSKTLPNSPTPYQSRAVRPEEVKIKSQPMEPQIVNKNSSLLNVNSSPIPSAIQTPTISPSPVVKRKNNCDPNYSGCVPIASDVDCAGGKGNGPAYVDGPVQVIGEDIYNLDRDGDGIGCDN